MPMLTFARRCTKEILRDPINLFFGLGFPLVLLVLLSAIQANIPVHLFEIDTLTPGITVFGLSFITLFSANRKKLNKMSYSETTFPPYQLLHTVQNKTAGFA